MKRTERWVIWLWILSLLAAATAVFAPGLYNFLTIFLILVLVGIPLAYILQILPTLALWLTLAAPAWLLLRRRGPLAASAGALLGVASAAAVLGGFPRLANRGIDARLDAMMADDRAEPVTLPPGALMAVLENHDPGATPDCNWHCQRLLFSGAATEVMLGTPDALKRPDAVLPRYWIGPAQGPCIWPKLPNLFADYEDLGIADSADPRMPTPPPVLSQAISRLAGDGRCLFRGQGRLTRAAVVILPMILLGKTRPTGSMDFSLDPVASIYGSRQEVLVRRQGRLTTAWRQTFVRAAPMAVPLNVQPYEAFDIKTQGGWRREQRERGKISGVSLHQIFTNDLVVRGLVDQHGVVYPLPPAS
jgi:hypothetical protein